MLQWLQTVLGTLVIIHVIQMELLLKKFVDKLVMLVIYKMTNVPLLLFVTVNMETPVQVLNVKSQIQLKFHATNKIVNGVLICTEQHLLAVSPDIFVDQTERMDVGQTEHHHQLHHRQLHHRQHFLATVLVLLMLNVLTLTLTGLVIATNAD